jgi:hypothetical protein
MAAEKKIEPPSWINSKSFSLQNMRLTYTKLMQKRAIEKIYSTLRIMQKNLILIGHLGSIHHF